jgi:DNA-binding transcriptional MerR regulator
MKIGELASRVGCNVQTIRFYEREGLLEGPQREPSGYRRSGERHLTRLNFIRHCRSLDIPLKPRRCAALTNCTRATSSAP